jgi:peptidoglycan hydrolase CwlO-like protein
MILPLFSSALIVIDAWSKGSGSRAPIYLADGPSPNTYGIAGYSWEPAVSDRPAISMDIGTPQVDGKIRAGRATFSIIKANVRSVDINALYLRSAPVRIYASMAEDLDLTKPEFDGRITSVRESEDGFTLFISAEVWTSDLEKPLLNSDFSGLGGINGDISLRGTLRPAGFGAKENIPPVWFDLTDNIGQIDGYGNTLAITRLMEGASDMGPRVDDYPTYAALKAAIVAKVIGPGQWGTCVAQGLVGLGSPPAGVITANATFGSNRIGQICRRIITTHAGVDVSRVDVAAFDAVDVALPYAVSYWTSSQRTVLDLFEKLALSAISTPLVTLQNRISISRAVTGAPVGTLDCSGAQEPRVTTSQTAELSAPYTAIKARSARPAAVLSIDQVFFIDDLIEVGVFEVDATYYAGNIVTMANGSRWLFISETPKAGSVPSDSNTDWQRLADAITAGNITYEDGTPVEALKPAEPGATDGMNDEERDEFDQLAADTATAQTNIAAAQAQIAAIQSSVAADFSAVNAEVDALQGAMTTAQGNIASIQSAQSDLSQSVAALAADMSAAEGSISNLQTSVNASLSALNSDVDALETQAAGIAASVTGLNTQVGSINTNVSALTTRIADAEGDIDSLQSTVASQGAAITANATAITNAQGSLAEYSLRLSSNRRNLLPNGGPEALLRGWTGSATWTVNTNNSEGAYFLCTPTASGTFVLTSDAIPMEASVALTLGYETRNTGATSYCDIQCYDASGANLMDGGQNAAASGTVWGDRAGRAFTLTTPANTASVRVRLVCVATSASDRARIRQVKLEKGTTWSAYSNDASVAQAFTAISSAEANVASLQTTVATQGASISSNATAITALTGRTATLETTVSSQGATIGTLQSAVSTANGNIASLTTRVNVSQTNLLPNGGLENGFSGAITSGSFSWSNAPEWGPIATTSTNGTQIFEFADITAVQVGATYWISCDPLALGASSIYCDLLFLDASGNVLLDGGQNSQAGPFNFSANDTRRSLIAVPAVAPSGTTKIRPRVVANVVSNQVAGFRRVKVETGNSWTPFSSEASLFSNWSATNTATASVASLTTTVSTQGASISSAQTAITTLQGSVSSLQTTVSTQGASITTLQSTTSTHTGQIAQHTTDIATANSNISANAQAITTANGNIASLTTRVSSAESSISSQATAITGLTGRTATLETTVSSQGASITSLQTTTSTTSANLATLTTRVNAASTNLLKYGGFESGATGWVVVGAASWGAVNGFWGPFVNTAGLSNGNAGLQSEQFDASPGQAWTASVDAEFLATAGQMYLQMAFLVSGSWTTVGTVYKTRGAGFTSTSDGRLRTTQTAPANTTKVRIQMGVVNVAGVTNCGFRQAKLEVGSVMSPYSNEASVYQTIQTLTTATGSLATLSTTVSTQGSSITSLQSSYTSLSGSLASLTTRVGTAESSITSLQSASTTQAGQISTLQSTVATQGSSISSNATAITTLQGNVANLTTRVNAAQTNLLVNGGLENGFAGAISDGGFTYGNWGTWGPNASTSTNGQHVFQFGDITQVQVGATYWISCDPLALGGSDICCDLLFLDASGNVLLDGPQNTQAGPFNYSTDDTRRGLIAVSAVAPSGTMRIRARIIGNVVSGATIGFRRVKVEMGTSWTGFSSEASIVQSFTAYSGLDSSLATLSSTVSTQGGSITSLQSSFTSLNGTVSSLSSTVSTQGTSISTLQTASSTQSGQIATLQTQIVLGGNLLQNTDFAVDTSGWFFNQSGSSHTGARDLLGDAYRLPNEHTLGIRQGDTNSTAYAFWQSTAVAVEPGKYYEASCLGANVNANLTIYLRFQDANGGTVQDFTAAKTSDSQGATLSAFLPLFRRGLAPAGATKVVVILLKNSTKAGSESYGWFTRPQLAQVPGLTGGPVAYSPGSASTTISTQATALSNATSSLASLTTTVNTQGATISSQATAISTLEGQQSSLSSTVSAQGAAISSLQTTTSTLQGNVASLTTRVAASSPNLLPNGGLENGFASGVGSAGGYSFAISADWGPIASTTATGTQVFQFAPVAANAGRVYTLACDSVCTGSGSAVYCDMLFRNAAGDILLDSAQNILATVSDFDTTTGRRGQIAVTATAPTGTTNIVCRFVGVPQNGGTVGFRQMKLERGSTWSPYSAEASITQSFSTLSTLGTQYASLSSTVATQGVSISTQATAITTIQGNVATVLGRWGVEIDVNGYVSGVAMNNNGQRSDFAVRADKFSIIPPSSTGERFEYSGNNIRIYHPNGNIAIRLGVA